MISRRLFLLIVELFPYPRKEPTLPPPQGLSHIQMLYLKQPLTPPQPCKIIVVDCTSNHRLAIKIRWCSTTPIPRYNRLCHIRSYNVVNNEAHFVLKCPLYNSIKDKFQSLFEKVVLGSLNWTIKLKIASTSQRLQFSATLGDQLV